MNLNRIGWPQEQDLLLKLVEMLEPLVLRTVPSSLFLNHKGLVPPSTSPTGMEPTPLLSSRMLIVLRLVRQERETPSGAEQSPNNLCEEEAGSLLEHPSPLFDARGSEQARASVPHQTQKICVQVENAIGQLFSSCWIESPRETLQYSLKLFKPDLGEIIESPAQDQSPSFLDSPPLESGPSCPQREPISNNRNDRTLPSLKSPTESSNPTIPGAFSVLDVARHLISTPFGSDDRRREEKKHIKKSTDQPSGEKETRSDLPEGKETVKKTVYPKPLDIKGVTAAPFIADVKRLLPARKKKKKKSFWLKKEKADEND